MSEVAEARPASTVVLLRDGVDGVETLLLRRNKALLFAGGFWVFPGGSIDPEDMAGVDGEEAASRIAAAREAHEEAGLRPQLDDMVLLSHWTTPEVEPKRFSTWIYAAPLEADDEVIIDGSEIHDSRWLTIKEALCSHADGELGILPPTFITLSRLAPYGTVAELVAAERDKPVPHLMPVVCQDVSCFTVLFPGDAGYESGKADEPGARHRARLEDKKWHYTYRDVDPDIAPLVPLELAS